LNYEYWFDVKDSLSEFHTVSDYILIYSYIFKENPIHIPSIKFWAMTILIIGLGNFKICDLENGIWTIEGCFREIEEIYDNRKEV